MKYPEGQLYEALYAKYIHKRPVSELIDLAGDIIGKQVLDVGCGTGRLLKECVARGAACVGIDISEEMTEALQVWAEGETGVDIYVYNVKSHLLYASAHKVKYDVVFSRQAVNYWLDRESAELLSRSVVPGGMFIFNTFDVKPSPVPVVKSYQYEGHNFVEVSWLAGYNVHHVQIRDGLPPHATTFRWIPAEEYLEILRDYFVVDVMVDGKTAIYVCTRRS